MNRRYALAFSIALVGVISAPLARTQQQKGAPPGASSTPIPQTAASAPNAVPTSAGTPTAASPASAKPAVPLTLQAQALLFYRTGKFDAAIDAYTKLASADPGAAYAGLTRVYLQQKRTADAYAAVNKAMELAPKAPDVHVALAEVYYRQGKIIEADRELVTVVNSGAHRSRLSRPGPHRRNGLILCPRQDNDRDGTSPRPRRPRCAARMAHHVAARAARKGIAGLHLW